MKIEKFEDIIAWQIAENLTIEIYKYFKDCKDCKDFSKNNFRIYKNFITL